MATRILAIDDDETARRFVVAVLQPAGYEVTTAPGGSAGLTLALGAPPDVVLLDVQMPEMDGYEVCRRLRRETRTREIPIVMLTATEDPKLNRLAYDAGAQACVPKPFRRESLIATIEAVRLQSARKAGDTTA
jgi:CheY-like chemotaxis protein